MIGVFAIAVGAAFVAFALGIFPMDEQPPVFFRVIFGLMGAFTVYGGLCTIRFRIKQRQAFSGGREREGTLRPRGKIDEDGDTSFAIFSTSYGEWLLMLNSSDMLAQNFSKTDGVRARAFLGEDDYIYGLQVGGKRVKLAGPGEPFEGRIQAILESAEKRFDKMAKKHSA